MIKLIASDLDGTLLKEGTMDINPEIYDIIRKLKAKGIVFAAVSGREYDSIERVFAPVKDDIYFIAGNGGIISYQGEIIEKMAIPADILKEVVEYVRAQEGASFMTAGSAQAYAAHVLALGLQRKLRIERGYAVYLAERNAQPVRDDLLHVERNAAKDVLRRLQHRHQRALLLPVFPDDLRQLLIFLVMIGHGSLRPPLF